MKAEIKQILISIKLMLNRRFTLRNQAFAEWERKITSASLSDDVTSVFFISDDIAHEFGWAEMIEMKRNFRQASQSAQSLTMRLTGEARRQEYIAARQSLQTIPSEQAICRIWNRMVVRWREELSVMADIRDASV